MNFYINSSSDSYEYTTSTSTPSAIINSISLNHFKNNKQNYVDINSISGFSGSNKWAGGVSGPNDKIYCIPRDSSFVLIIDPSTNSVDTTSISGLYGGNKWSGGVLAPNGKIYCIPRDSQSVLIIDPESNTADSTTISGLTGTNKYGGGVLGSDGKIYCLPRNSNNVLIIDPSTNMIDTTSITGLSGDWIGGVLARNGKIYGIPLNTTSVLILNPSSPLVDISNLYGINIKKASYDNANKKLICGSSLLLGLKIGDNIIIKTETASYTGYIQSLSNTYIKFFYPLGNDLIEGSICKIEKTKKADITSITDLEGTNKWSGGILFPNGKICGIPYNSKNLLIIDPDTNIVDISVETQEGDLKWNGAVYGKNGRIYGIPFNHSSVLIINPMTLTYPIINITNITGLTGNNKYGGGVLGSNGIIYGIPYNSPNVLQIKNSTPTLVF